MYCKVILLGNLGKDAETKKIGNGLVLRFSVATHRKKVTGETETDWHNVSYYAKEEQAWFAGLRSGTMVFVDGSLHYYKTKDGATSCEIYAQAVRVLAPSKKSIENKDDEPPY